MIAAREIAHEAHPVGPDKASGDPDGSDQREANGCGAPLNVACGQRPKRPLHAVEADDDQGKGEDDKRRGAGPAAQEEAAGHQEGGRDNDSVPVQGAIGVDASEQHRGSAEQSGGGNEEADA